MTFWSQNNTLIIEILIGLILVMVVYMAFRSFFGEEASEESTAGGPRSALDTAQLEKTLQRFMEQQKPAAAASEAPAATAAAPAAAGATSTTLGESAAPAAAASEEANKLKADLAEREREIQELKKQSAAATEAVSKGLNEEDKKKLEDKMKDLEARLAEYEIISEDIADLSFYKEENARLQKEMEELRKGAPAEAPAETAAPPPLDAAAEAALAEMAAAAPAPEPVPEPEAPLTPPLPTDQKPSEDPALKEMAQAAAETEEKKPADELPPGEASQLMNQFENFVKKG